jgi:hypothetical protein
MASPSDIPKIQSNFNLNQTIATESSKIDKDRKENPHEQSESKKDDNEKDTFELSKQAQEKLEINKTENSKPNALSDEDDNEDEPGLNIDIKI